MSKKDRVAVSEGADSGPVRDPLLELKLPWDLGFGIWDL